MQAASLQMQLVTIDRTGTYAKYKYYREYSEDEKWPEKSSASFQLGFEPRTYLSGNIGRTTRPPMRLPMIIQVVQNSNQVLKNKKNNPGFVSDPTG